MTHEQAQYDMKTLPLRNCTLRAMAREPWQTVEGLRILREEFRENLRRLEQARKVLGLGEFA